MLQCYNKGCGKKFESSTNTSSSCRFHPGPPYFHDAYKIWNCCGKKSTDFSTWLNISGCTVGLHSNEKPIEEEQKKQNSDVKSSGTSVTVQGNAEIHKRFSGPPAATPRGQGGPLFELTKTVLPSLAQLLKDNPLKQQVSEIKDGVTDIDLSKPPPPGTQCKNNACKVAYIDEKSLKEECLYHPGSPIFHEGLKYWSCCKKTTTEFDSFLEQEGCTSGKHVWLKPKSADNAENKKKVRQDWHQTSSNLVITFYLKGPIPDSTVIRANKTSIEADIIYDLGRQSHTFQLELWGSVDPSGSKFTLTPTKVEILLKKMSNISWPRLAFDNVKDNKKT